MLPHKAERREGTCKFVCPVPSCNFRKEGSRVFIAKHFRVVHKDYRQGCISCMSSRLKSQMLLKKKNNTKSCKNIPVRFRGGLAEILHHSPFLELEGDSRNLAEMVLHNSVDV